MKGQLSSWVPTLTKAICFLTQICILIAIIKIALKQQWTYFCIDQLGFLFFLQKKCHHEYGSLIFIWPGEELWVGLGGYEVINFVSSSFFFCCFVFVLTKEEALKFQSWYIVFSFYLEFFFWTLFGVDPQHISNLILCNLA